MRGYCLESKMRIEEFGEKDIKAFINEVPEKALRTAFKKFPIPHGFTPGRPNTLKQQVKDLARQLRKIDSQPKRMPVYPTLEVLWKLYGSYALNLSDELREYDELVEAEGASSIDPPDLLESDMALVESILTGETKKVTSDEMLRYCDFAPFVLPEELRSRIESSLPTQISIVREKQIEETAERIKQLERQLEDVHLIIDSDEEKIEDVGQLIANLDVSLQKLKVDTESDFERLKKASASYRESLDLIEARVSASESDFRKLKSVSDGTALAANEAFSGLQDVHTAISEMASHLTAFKNELDSLKSKTDDLHLHTQSVGHQSAGPDIHYKVVEPPEGVTRIDDLGLLATSFICISSDQI